ncbi:DNA polymerase IV [Rudaeicoccus suwonensis]|uniref:DNA polymerase IV n=1 Tax=Rudaeicoccus suwonensis TaxID=657409 RepID=A0A561E458_9MICO|nr:DNA polymerase IV [Rudaeicoccus suwonensis]TWE10392.1 DNA polymerase-4 [Rudaeicoccus suwonensis]
MFVTEGGILHADLDSFYASVEQRDDPRLRGRPVVVGGGVVLAASYEAKAHGIRTPMSGRIARQLCPGLIEVPPRFTAYADASRAVFDIFADTTPLVEGISIDEAFLEVGGLRRVSGTPTQIGAALRRRVSAEVGLPISVGIAATKFLAKVASAASKPDGLLSVPVGGELAFLHPLPIEALWGVGKVTAGKLHDRGVVTVGDLAALNPEVLVSIVGPGAGHHLHELAHARDPRRVRTGVRRRSIGAQRAIGRGRHTGAELDATLVALVDKVTRRLRAGERVGRTFTLRLRFADFTRATRSRTVPRSRAGTQGWLAVGRELLEAAMPMIADRGITLLGISIGGLEEGDTEQLELPLAGLGFGDGSVASAAGAVAVPMGGQRATPDSARTLDGALDAVRDRFGMAAVTRGVLLGRDDQGEMPMLPDPAHAKRHTG